METISHDHISSDPFSRTGLLKQGFYGFLSIAELQGGALKEVPAEKGVYIVLRTGIGRPLFLDVSVGGRFRGKDPSDPIWKLQKKWVEGSSVLYIGKAGGATSRATLQSRIRQYILFGRGKPIGHYGGRYFWQLRDSGKLLVCWKPMPEYDPRVLEKKLLSAFKNKFSCLPFANLKH